MTAPLQQNRESFNRDHVDYTKIVVPLKRWIPDRPVGESVGDVGDARGDESLYKPSALGRARASVQCVAAGANQPFELEFETGPAGLTPGTRVKFFVAGQGSLGTQPQLTHRDRPGFIEAAAPAAATIELFCAPSRAFNPKDGERTSDKAEPGDFVVGPVVFGFILKEGTLVEGDRVVLSIGMGNSGFVWKKLVGRKEFKVIIEPPDNRPKMRLPEPVVIEVLPLAPVRIEVLLPPTYEPGERVTALISVRDRHDNRVSHDGPVELTAESMTRTGYVSAGIGRTELDPPSDPQPFQFRAKASGMQGEWLSNCSIPAGQTNDQGMRLFIGDMHAHDFNSSSEGYPADVHLWARDEKRLDFLAVPLQVHRYIDNEKWALAKHMAEYFLDEGRFVTFLSFEWQHSHYGDKVIHYLGGDMPYLPIDDPRYACPNRLYDALRQTDALIVSHHPGYELDLHVPGTDWSAVETDVDRLVEIWSMHGSSEGYDAEDRPVLAPRRPGGVMEGLRKGCRMGFTAGSDTHTARPGGSEDSVRPYWGGLCAVWAHDLTRRSLFEAFRARRTYALTRSRVVLNFTVNGSMMGSEIPRSEAYELEARIWAPTDVARVQFLRNSELIHEASPDRMHCRIELTDDGGGAGGDSAPFYHCRVELQDGELAVCSPVWVTK